MKNKIQIKLAVYGEAGLGKTSAIAELSKHRKTLLCDSEKGSVYLEGRGYNQLDIKHLDKWLSIKEQDAFMKEIIEKKYEVVAIDTLNSYIELLIDDLKRRLNIGDAEEIKNWKVWSLLGTEFLAFYKKLKETGVDIVFMIHEKEYQQNIISRAGGEETIQTAKPFIQGKILPFELMKDMDFVARSYIVDNNYVYLFDKKQMSYFSKNRADAFGTSTIIKQDLNVVLTELEAVLDKKNKV